VPPEAFVDARNFHTRRELLRYLQSCPEREWAAMREAGEKFLNSAAFRLFTDDAFAERMTNVLKKILM